MDGNSTFERLRSMLAHTLSAAPIPEEVRRTATALYDKTLETFLVSRTRADNRIEHELIVFDHFVRILTSEEFDEIRTEESWKVGTAFCFLHDNFAIERLTESRVQKASGVEREAMEHRKFLQRREHMLEGARSAKTLLESDELEMSDREISRVLGYIALHDVWKLGITWPLSSIDVLGVVLLDSDCLWPVSFPFGPFGDLQRDDDRSAFPFDVLLEQVEDNRRNQLEHYRGTFEGLDPKLDLGDNTVLRTIEGRRLLSEYFTQWSDALPGCEDGQPVGLDTLIDKSKWRKS